jgi:hypothetical protein
LEFQPCLEEKKIDPVIGTVFREMSLQLVNLKTKAKAKAKVKKRKRKRKINQIQQLKMRKKIWNLLEAYKEQKMLSGWIEMVRR